MRTEQRSFTRSSSRKGCSRIYRQGIVAS
jgi:hypothetical protein